MNSTSFCIAYFGSKLFGAPEDWFSNLEERNDPALLSFDSLSAAFLSQFSVTRSQWQIRLEMHGITQGTRSVADYVTHFRSLANKLPGYGDEALLTQFYYGLNPIIQTYLGSLPHMPDTLKDIVDICIEYGGRAPITGTNSSRSPTPANHQRLPMHPMEVDHVEITSSSRKVFKPLTAEEKALRLKKNLCVYCGADSHAVDKCPKLAQRKN